MANDADPLSWPDERYLTRDEAAAYARALGLRMEAGTLAKYAWRGDGSPMTYFGAKPYYKLADFRSWLAARMRRSRSTTRRNGTKSRQGDPSAESGGGADRRRGGDDIDGGDGGDDDGRR